MQYQGRTAEATCVNQNMTVKKISAISAEFSLYLDVLRVGAAYFVLLFHMKLNSLGPPSLLKLVPNHGHDAVILFFVLSGYVIAAATDRKQAYGFRTYLLDRASRVYSVALPALFLSVVLAWFFQSFLKFTGSYLPGDMVFSTFANLLFIGQSWSLKEWVFYNQPYWSLCYEVMYYLGFGVFVFARGWRRYLGLLLLALISGPKVLLLLPCWVFGVMAYRCRDCLPLKPTTGFVVGFILPVLALFALNKLGFGPAVRAMALDVWGDQKSYLEFSNDFLIDYVTAILVAINLYSVRYIKLSFLHYFKRGVEWAASFSFTLYLMHLPMIFLLVNGLANKTGTVYSFVAGAVVIPLVCYLIALATEQKRPALRRIFDRYLPARML